MNVQSTTIKIVVNGDPLELPEKSTLSDLLSQLKLRPELVVVELNLNILKREQVSQTTLKEGDQVEIVHFVGGGASPAPGRGARLGVLGSGLAFTFFSTLFMYTWMYLSTIARPDPRGAAE